MEGESLLSAWKAATARLEAAGVESPAVDARLLLEHAAGVSRNEILTDPYRALAPEQRAAFEAVLRRREAREPVSHILGRRAFWTLELQVSPAVLTPRPETEFLVQAVLQRSAAEAPLRVLDLGLGSGAILFAILAERAQAFGAGVEISPAALAVARSNAQHLGLDSRCVLIEGRFAAAPPGPYDFIVSNPPYIKSGDIAGLQPEVAVHEPRAALDGGPDGLDAYREIAPLLKTRLAPEGLAVLELGPEQAAPVQEILEAEGLRLELALKDFERRARVLLFRG